MSKIQPVIFILLIFLAAGPAACRGGGREADTGEGAGVQEGRSAGLDEPAISGSTETATEAGEDNGAGTITVSGPGGMSVEWPKDIPVASGMVLQGVILNDVGGFDATFQAEGSEDRIPGFYRQALADWEFREPSEQAALKEGVMLSCFRDDETFDLVVVSIGGGNELDVTVQYKWRTPPGVLPEGWPSYIPLMPGMVFEYGCNGGGGERTVCLSGEIIFERIADYYADVLSDWNRHGLGISPETGHRFMMINFDRESERVALSGREVGETSVILLSWLRQP